MPITIHGIGAYAFGTGPLTPSLPAGVLPGMMLVMEVESHAGEAAAASGWTEAPDSPVNNANGTRLTLLWRRATGSGDAPTVIDSGDHQSARIIAYDGVVEVGDPWNVTNSTTGDTSAISVPGDTTTEDECLIHVAVAHGLDTLGEQVSGWANGDLTNGAERFDDSTDVGNGGGIACWTADLATAGMFGATTATLSGDAPWAGWVGALIPAADSGSEEEPDSGGEEPGGSEESEEDNEVPPSTELGIGTFQWDTQEPVPADRDPIDYYLVWQYMDHGAESRDKKISAIRVTAKGKDMAVQIHAASPGDEIEKDDIESGVNARAAVTFIDSTEVTRYERKKVNIKQLSIWTARFSGTDDGQDEIRDRLDELVIEGGLVGVKR